MGRDRQPGAFPGLPHLQLESLEGDPGATGEEPGSACPSLSVPTNGLGRSPLNSLPTAGGQQPREMCEALRTADLRPVSLQTVH